MVALRALFLTAAKAHSTVTCFHSDSCSPHATGDRHTAEEDAAQHPPPRVGSPHGPVQRLGHAGRVLAASRTSTWPCAPRAGLFDVSHMGEIEIAGEGRARGRPAHLLQRRLEAAGGTGAVFRPARRRRAPSSTTCSSTGSAPRTSCSSSTPGTSPRTTRGSPSTSRRAGDAVAVDASSRYALIAVQGPEAVERPPAADRRRPGGDEVLLVRARRGGQRACHRLAHRLHRRGRLRDFRAAGVGRPRVAGAPRVGQVGRA